jgi:pimeloyl-ACP methyl ester carboxylesterase
MKALRTTLGLLLALVVAGCATAPPDRSVLDTLTCARDAYSALAQGADPGSSVAKANACGDVWLTAALQDRREWEPGRVRVLGSDIEVEFRQLSPWLGQRISLTRATGARLSGDFDPDAATPRFGIPLAAMAPRCSGAAVCKLLPYSGVFRASTAWIEPDPVADARLVIADPLRVVSLRYGDAVVPLALDTSTPYELGMRPSPIGGISLRGLLGGDEMARRAGVYLMEDYDPAKRPLIMVHGLGSSPLIWGKLSKAIWSDPVVRSQFQVWYVVYPTDAPLLVTRRRIAGYLDTAFATLDPERNDASRHGIVLVGHSLGGVLARLLCADSGDILWSATFTVPPGELPGNGRDVALADELLRFSHYPGVVRAVFVAAPHHGSPLADRWYSRIVYSLAGRRALEMQALRRIARAHPEAVQPPLRNGFRNASINSITTLQAAQPVRRANEQLLPASGIAYHTIAGRLPGRQPEGDGAVPLSSARLAGAASTFVVEAGHDLYHNDAVIAEVLRILHADIGVQLQAARIDLGDR